MVSRLFGSGFGYFERTSIPEKSSHPRSVDSCFDAGLLVVISSICTPCVGLLGRCTADMTCDRTACRWERNGWCGRPLRLELQSSPFSQPCTQSVTSASQITTNEPLLATAQQRSVTSSRSRDIIKHTAVVSSSQSRRHLLARILQRSV